MMFPEGHDRIGGLIQAIFGDVSELSESETRQVRCLIEIAVIGYTPGSLADHNKHVARLVSDCGVLSDRLVKYVDSKVFLWAHKYESAEPQYGLSGELPARIHGALGMAFHWIRHEAEMRDLLKN
ncbi:hypothetical protein [Roseibium sediminis]|uniref:hypothetical protein n=1 Tax=Roseibium sediminis TaxID=1775174 RepID=UPI00123D0886|nr:hypothetical protein [Roseibium sediminis]